MLEYMEQFQAIAMSIDNANDHELLHAFVWGLKDRLCAEVRLRNPKTLDEAARMALDFDELLKPQRKLVQQWYRPQNSFGNSKFG